MISCGVCLAVSSHDGIITLITVTLIMIDCSHPVLSWSINTFANYPSLVFNIFHSLCSPHPNSCSQFFCSGSLLDFITLNFPLFLLLKLLAVSRTFFTAEWLLNIEIFNLWTPRCSKKWQNKPTWDLIIRYVYWTVCRLMLVWLPRRQDLSKLKGQKWNCRMLLQLVFVLKIYEFEHCFLTQ